MGKNIEELQTVLEDMKLDESIFTEEVMKRMALVVETQVNDKLDEEKEKLNENNKEEISQFKDQLIDQLDEYMNYFVEQFISENQQHVIDSVKLKTAEKILENFNTMVNEFNISLSEDSIDQSDIISDLEESLNEAVNTNIELKREQAESSKYALILEKVMKIDVDSERSRFAKLAEKFEYEDDESFEDKLNTLQEGLEIPASDDKALFESQEEEESSTKTLQESNVNVGNQDMKSYLKVLKRSRA